MVYEEIEFDVDSRGVATLLLNQPSQGNALTRRMIAELTQVVAEVESHESVRCMVLTGVGNLFCAGGNISDFERLQKLSEDQRAEEASQFYLLLDRLNRLPVPTIAKVQGSAFGGGIGLISVCDVAIACPSASYALSEVRLGLVPATISPFVIARIGEHNMRRYSLSGSRFHSDAAQRIGLLHEVSNSLDDDVAVMVAEFLSASPAAVAECKTLLAEISKKPGGDNKMLTAQCLARVLGSKDAAEGVASFLEKRPPCWRS